MSSLISRTGPLMSVSSAGPISHERLISRTEPLMSVSSAGPGLSCTRGLCARGCSGLGGEVLLLLLELALQLPQPLQPLLQPAPLPLLHPPAQRARASARASASPAARADSVNENASRNRNGAPADSNSDQPLAPCTMQYQHDAGEPPHDHRTNPPPQRRGFGIAERRSMAPVRRAGVRTGRAFARRPP